MQVVHPEKTSADLQALWYELSQSQFAALTLAELSSDVVDEVTALSRNRGLDEVVAGLKAQLDEPELGYAFVDLSPHEACAPKQRARATALAATAIFRALATPTTDPHNQTPFNVYKSSAERAAAMREAGIHFYAPDEKLGFHNDAVVSGDVIRLPRYVGLLNLFIGYDRPGNFYWLPITHWTDRTRWVDALGAEARAVVDTTPMVYESELGSGDLALQASGEFEVSLFPDILGSVQPGPGVFMNGTVRRVVDAAGRSIADGAARLQASLMACPRRIALPQRAGRLILLRNDSGVHSRDIFTEQTISKGVTRLLLRTMSREATTVGRRLSPTT